MKNAMERNILLIALSVLLFNQTAPLLSAGTITLGFDDLPDSEILTNQYPGLTFGNAIVLASGISLNEFEFPPKSGTNVISDNGGPLMITFSSPVLSVSGYFTYLASVTITAFDAGNNPVGAFTSLFSSNMALSGEVGSTPNELLTLAHAGGIASVVITGDQLGGSFTLDHLTLDPAVVPEPASSVFFLTGVAAMAALRKQRFT
jgi:hypothetical protein